MWMTLLRSNSFSVIVIVLCILCPPIGHFNFAGIGHYYFAVTDDILCLTNTD